MSNTQHFDDMAKGFDAGKRKTIPCFEQFYGYPLDYLAFDHARPHILDAGTGTGVFAEFALDKFPGAHATVIDFSKEMLNVARSRLKDRSVTFIHDDYMNYDFSAQFDAVITALSVHHLDMTAKKFFFRKCYSWLKPGGMFINADHVGSYSRHIEERNMDLWVQHLLDEGMSEQRVEEIRHGQRHDDPATVEEQMRWLLDAGFTDVDCVYKYGRYAAVYAKKH